LKNEIVGFSEELPGDPDQGDPARGDGRTQEHELHRRQASRTKKIALLPMYVKKIRFFK
jgi:hypothetical protein